MKGCGEGGGAGGGGLDGAGGRLILCRCAGDGLRSVGQPRWHRRHADRPAPARFNRRKKPKRVPTRRYRAFQVQLLPKNVTVYCNVAAWLRAAHPPKHGQPHALSHPGGALHTNVCTIHRCRPRCRRATGSRVRSRVPPPATRVTSAATTRRTHPSPLRRVVRCRSRYPAPLHARTGINLPDLAFRALTR